MLYTEKDECQALCRVSLGKSPSNPVNGITELRASKKKKSRGREKKNVARYIIASRTRAATFLASVNAVDCVYNAILTLKFRGVDHEILKSRFFFYSVRVKIKNGQLVDLNI